MDKPDTTPQVPAEASPETKPGSNVNVNAVDLTAEVLEVLGLTAEASPEELRAALAALGERAEMSARTQAELDALKQQLASADQAKADETFSAEISALLDGLTVSDAVRGIVEAAYKQDAESARELVASMRPAAAVEVPEVAEVTEAPPAPMHDPAADVAEGSAAETARKVAERAEQLIAADKKLGWAEAETRARREIAKEAK
jgi:hypothetical protein